MKTVFATSVALCVVSASGQVSNVSFDIGGTIFHNIGGSGSLVERDVTVQGGLELLPFQGVLIDDQYDYPQTAFSTTGIATVDLEGALTPFGGFSSQFELFSDTDQAGSWNPDFGEFSPFSGSESRIEYRFELDQAAQIEISITQIAVYEFLLTSNGDTVFASIRLNAPEPGLESGDVLLFDLPAGESTLEVVNYFDPFVANEPGGHTFSGTVSIVPAPASGLLLLTGIAATRRRLR